MDAVQLKAALEANDACIDRGDERAGEEHAVEHGHLVDDTVCCWLGDASEQSGNSGGETVLFQFVLLGLESDPECKESGSDCAAEEPDVDQVVISDVSK